ncbi:MAG: hypothetical protein OXH08_03150 [Gammaproteobacteria bacterium]|nr:hypothetical protein [Gammaproteobacteria bacterium]MDE0649125.1 hypothetical protein [Gammaproteobacteria bacterium]
MRTRGLLPTVLAATAICMAAPGCDPASPPVHTIHADSAGIAVATAIEPLWGPGEGWTVEPEPLLEIGTVTGAPEYQFTDVIAAVRLSNGDIVVAERAASELRSYDATGNFQWRAGRSGEGPGEFRSLDFVGTTAGDSLVTYDGALLRAQLFDPQGGLVRSFRVAITEGEAVGRAIAADKAVGIVDGLLVVRFIESGDEVPTGVVRWPLERVATLDPADGTVRSLIVVPGREQVVRAREEGGLSQGTYIFAKEPEYGAAAGRLAVIDTEAWSVRMISPRDGATTAVFRRDLAPREATGALFELHLDGIVEIAFADPDQTAPERVDGLRRMWRGMPRAPHLPVLRSIHVDGTGHLWLQPYYVAGADPPPFEVHAPNGTWLGSVALPPGLHRAFIQYQAPYMEIGDDYVLGVWTDELDVQYVRMYRINK